MSKPVCVDLFQGLEGVLKGQNKAQKRLTNFCNHRLLTLADRNLDFLYKGVHFMNKFKLVLVIALVSTITPALAMQRAVTGSRAFVRPANNMIQRGYALLSNQERDALTKKLWDTMNVSELDKMLLTVKTDREDLEAIFKDLQDSELNPNYIRSSRLSIISDSMCFGGAGLCLLMQQPIMAICFLMPCMLLHIKPDPDAYKFNPRGLAHLKKLVEEKKKVEYKQ